MRRICLSVAIASVAALAGVAPATPANAAPPTVTPTPGYDARLQEQRAAQTHAAPAHEPVVRYPRPRPRHHARRVHESVY